MTDEKLFDDDAPENERKGEADGDSGLGNLPPLSEFDSQGGFDSDGDLPPLGDFESQDTSVANGVGAGGADGFGSADVSSDIDSLSFASEPPLGVNSQGASSTGFQDLAADSDFSPETPDIGPGPDSTLDTPIFDSAFGGGDSGFDGDQTSTATQAMESPMFDDFGGEGDFGSPGGDTPMPDFSPDTGFGDPVGAGAPMAAGVGAQPPSGPSGASKKGASPVLIIFLGLLSLGVGVIASQPLSAYLGFVPANPLRQELATKDTTIANLQGQVNRLQQLQATEDRPVEISPERVAELQNEILRLSQEMDAVNGQLDSTRATLDTQQRELSSVERELRERTDEVISAREFLDELRNETAIVQARQRGLIAEVDRLTGYVGELDVANARRLATKEALEHNIDRLAIQVKESIPLAPRKYDHAQRLAEVEALRTKAAQVSWVTPELQSEYTGLYLRELERAQASDYFFARIPVTDRYGHTELAWAECLMRGSWAVYYRSLDGKTVGSFENIGTTQVPRWGFRQELSAELSASIEAHIIAARVPDFEGQVQVLAERELAAQDGNVWQRTYESL